MNTHLPSMQSVQLDVTNFGPIVNAKLDLRPFTVFVGPSNTGKSYLAILIYALHQFYSQRGVNFDSVFRRTRPGGGRIERLLSEDRIEELLVLSNSVAEELETHSTSTVVLTPGIAKILGYWYDENRDVVANAICRCFGLDDAQSLVRKGTARSADVVIRQRFSETSENFIHALKLASTLQLTSTIAPNVPIEVTAPADYWVGRLARYGEELSVRHRSGDSLRSKRTAIRTLSLIADLMVPPSVGTLALPAYYLPADRTGIVHAHTVVVSALIDSATSAGIRHRATTPVLSGVLADFLDQMIRIYPDRRHRSVSKLDIDPGSMIERAVLGGTVKAVRSETANYPHFAYRPGGWEHDLPLANASSMVSELAPVVLYLRHVVTFGNVLIIEEPESHLHPAMQVELTRQLARLVNLGVKIIITTHSEWLLDELANIVRRSTLQEQKNDNDFKGEVFLRPDQVGAWLFTPKSRPKGSIVREIQLDDSGLYPSGYEEVSIALHNDWAEITSQIEN